MDNDKTIMNLSIQRTDNSKKAPPFHLHSKSEKGAFHIHQRPTLTTDLIAEQKVRIFKSRIFNGDTIFSRGKNH